MFRFPHTARVLAILITIGILATVPLRAQEQTPDSESGPTVEDVPVEERLEQIRTEMVSNLARLEDLRRERGEREANLEQARADLVTAEEEGDPDKIEAARESVGIAEEFVASIQLEIEERQLLYDQAAERFQIAREQANLAGVEVPTAAAPEGTGAPLLETLQRRGQVTQAEQEAALAEQRVDALRAEAKILERQQERVRGEIDRINRVLDEGRQLDRQQRQELTTARQQLIDEDRFLEDRISDLRAQAVLAAATLRIKRAEAERELEEYRYWQRQLVTSLGLLLTVIVVLVLLRFLASRTIKDPERLYATNRALSIAMTLVLLIGLGVIFLRQFPSMMTGIGVVLAGVAIALQEVILSFFGFFAIRGARGYRIGDWIRVGDHYGEVVDVGLLVTILEEVTPIDFQGLSGGAKTGALIWVNNSSIFREKMTNYTRGFPYIWCALTFTITYESDWKAAEGLLRGILGSHDEILTTAKLARKKLTKAAANLALKVDDTSPRIRTWAADSGISFRVRFMVHPRRRRAMIDAFNREVIDAFMASPDIDFAYNTMRVIPTPAGADD